MGALAIFVSKDEAHLNRTKVGVRVIGTKGKPCLHIIRRGWYSSHKEVFENKNTHSILDGRMACGTPDIYM